MINLENLTKILGNLDENEVLSILDNFLESNPSQEDVQKVVAACQGGMSIVGDLYEKGEYYVGDLIFAGELLTNALEKLKPVLGLANKKEVGTIVLGTVKGDLHDIGKNIFKLMADAAGFNVVDLGIDTSAEAFVSKVKEVKPVIVGMSGVLTLALDAMKDTVNALTEAALRDDVKVIIGGNPVTKEACEQIGADAFTINAAEGVKICLAWV